MSAGGRGSLVGHTEATSSAAHPEPLQNWCLPPPHPPFNLVYFLSFMLHVQEVIKATCLHLTSSYLPILNFVLDGIK